MEWQANVAATIFFGYILGKIIQKRIVGLPSREKLLVWQFAFCAMFSAGLILVLGGVQDPMPALYLIAGLGVFNAIACYCQWRAIDLSLAGTSVLTQGDDVIGLLLAYTLLGETRILTPLLATVVALCVAAAFVFGSGRIPKSRKLIGWVSVYSVIWGVAFFAMRYFALQGVSAAGFLSAWYAGSLLGSFVVPLLFGKRGAARVKVRELAGTALLAACVWTALLAAYAARKLAPITITQPLFQLGELGFPFLIGLYIFREYRTFGIREKIASVIGFAGSIILAMY